MHFCNSAVNNSKRNIFIYFIALSFVLFWILGFSLTSYAISVYSVGQVVYYPVDKANSTWNYTLPYLESGGKELTAQTFQYKFNKDYLKCVVYKIENGKAYLVPVENEDIFEMIFQGENGYNNYMTYLNNALNLYNYTDSYNVQIGRVVRGIKYDDLTQIIALNQTETQIFNSLTFWAYTNDTAYCWPVNSWGWLVSKKVINKDNKENETRNEEYSGPLRSYVDRSESRSGHGSFYEYTQGRVTNRCSWLNDWGGYMYQASYTQPDNDADRGGWNWTHDMVHYQRCAGPFKVCPIIEVDTATVFIDNNNRLTSREPKQLLTKPTLRSSRVYNGSEQTVDLNDFDNDTMEIVSGGAYTNAGDYTVTIRIRDTSEYHWAGESGDEESGDYEIFDDGDDNLAIDWSIERANITPVITMSGYAYGGTKSNPSLVSGNPGNGTVTYYYNRYNSNLGGTAWSSVTDSSSLTAETYYMYATVSQTANYNFGVSDPFPFTITDENSLQNCWVKINNASQYTNSRYVTLDLYCDAYSAVEVWVSNDGINGTVFDFYKNTAGNEIDGNYSELTLPNDGTFVPADNNVPDSTIYNYNGDNVFRINNWPLSSINGEKIVYTVFRDAYGNKTSVSDIQTVTVTFDVGDKPVTCPPVQTPKGMAVRMPNIEATSTNYIFKGWTLVSGSDVANYAPLSIKNSFYSDTTLYAVYTAVSAGQFLWLPINRNSESVIIRTDSPYNLITLGKNTQDTFNLANRDSLEKFVILSVEGDTIRVCPAEENELIIIHINGNSKNAKRSSRWYTVCDRLAGLYTYTSGGNTIVSPDSTDPVLTKAKINTLLSFSNPHVNETYSSHARYCRYWAENTSDRPRFGWCSATKDSYNGFYGPQSVEYAFAPTLVLGSTVRLNGIGSYDSPYSLSW